MVLSRQAAHFLEQSFSQSYIEFFKDTSESVWEKEGVQRDAAMSYFNTK